MSYSSIARGMKDDNPVTLFNRVRAWLVFRLLKGFRLMEFANGQVICPVMSVKGEQIDRIFYLINDDRNDRFVMSFSQGVENV